MSPTERAWLAAHPVIRLGVDPGYAPYGFMDENGQFKGVAADFSARIEKLLGVRFEPVGDLTWPQLLEAAKAGRVDVLATAVRLPERQTYLDFSAVYIPTPLVIMTREVTPRLPDAAALESMHVALVRGYSSSRQALQHYPGLKPYYVDSPRDGLNALSSGVVDAYVGVLGVNTYLASRLGITNLKVNAAFDMRENGQRFGVRKDWPQLTRLLDKALGAIPEEDKTAIFYRWLPVRAEQVPVLGSPLSQGDRRWLWHHPRLRVGITRDNRPFEFVDAEGHPAGVVVDMLRMMQDNAAVVMQVQAHENQAELLASLGRRELDLVVTTAVNAPPDTVLTRPFHRTSLMIFSADHRHFSGARAELAGQRVAVRRSGMLPHLIEHDKEIHLLPVDSVHQALAMLDRGEADAAVLEGAQGLRELEISGLAGVHAQAPLVGGEISLRFAVHADRPQLAQVLDHLIEAITPEQHAQILNRWLPLPRRGLNRTRVLQWVVGGVLLAMLGYLAILLWNRQLQRELARRQRAERTLLAEREQALREVRERRSVLESIFHSIPDLFFHLTADGVILDYQASDRSELYAPPEMFLGKRMQDVLPPGLGVQFLENLYAVHSGGDCVSYEYELNVPQGQRRFEARLTGLADSDQVIALVRDVTESHRDRQARLVEAERMQLILNTTLDGYLLADASGAIQDINPAYCDIVGYRREKLLSMNVNQLEANLSEAEVAERIRSMLEAGHMRFETRHFHRDGHQVELEVSLSIMDQQGLPLVAAFVRDVSARKQAEAALKQAHGELEKRVAQRTAELSAANQELESFSYAVSHDLRAPLRAIQGFHQALLEDYGGELTAGARDFLDEIATGGRRMGELIDGLLALSRSTRGALVREPLRLDLLAQETHERLARGDAGRRVELIITEPLPAEADSRLVRTLLQNLLENAWKYTANSAQPRVTLSKLEIDGEMAFCVEDNGAGFDMDFSNKLFEPFQRLHHQNEFPGIGIGLATVQRIVHRHGGWIRGESKEGGGARFCFTLLPGREVSA